MSKIRCTTRDAVPFCSALATLSTTRIESSPSVSNALRKSTPNEQITMSRPLLHAHCTNRNAKERKSCNHRVRGALSSRGETGRPRRRSLAPRHSNHALAWASSDHRASQAKTTKRARPCSPVNSGYLRSRVPCREQPRLGQD